MAITGSTLVYFVEVELVFTVIAALICAAAFALIGTYLQRSEGENCGPNEIALQEGAD